MNLLIITEGVTEGASKHNMISVQSKTLSHRQKTT